MNKAVIVGRLVRDPDVRALNDGKTVSKFTVAVDRRFKNKNGEKEADFKAGKISVNSPIGKGLLGKAKGEIAEVQTPAGLMKFKVNDISI